MSHATRGFVLDVLWEPFSAGVGKDVHEIVRAQRCSFVAPMS